MKKLKKLWPYILIGFIVILFFFPLFKGYIPFPGDLLVNQNPYKTLGFAGYSAGGYPNKAQGPDVIYEIYPWRYFSVEQIKNGNIPFWNPHNFSGNPQIANFQTGLFYPFNFLYLVLPFNISWSFLIMLQPFLGAIFMYLFLKKGLKLHDLSSVLAGLAFGFSSYMSVWMEYGNIGNTLAWLPLVLLFTKKYFEDYKVSSLVGILVALVFSILAGYIQGAFYIYSLCFLYYLFLSLKNLKNFYNHKKNLLFILALVFPIFLTAFQILPTLQIFSNSTRGAYSLTQIENNLSPFFNLITIFFPDFFGNPVTRNYWIDGTYIERVMYPGIVILFFALFAIYKKINISEKKFFFLVAFGSLVLATNLPLVKYFYLIPIPLISTTIPTRELSLFIFSMIVLAALGINEFLNEKKIEKKFLLFSVMAVGIIWGLVIFSFIFNKDLHENLKISLKNMIIPSALLIATIIIIVVRKIDPKYRISLILILVTFDAFFFFHKITPFAPQDLTYPKTPIIEFIKDNSDINRFWGYGSAYIPSNFQSIDQTFSPEGNDPLHIARYGELLASSDTGRLPTVIPRPDANIAPGYGPDELKNNPNRKRVLDLIGVKYILHKQELEDAWYQEDLNTFPRDSYKLAYKVYPWQVYENKDALPRFFITSNYIVVSKNKALEKIYDKSLDLRKTLILEKRPSFQATSTLTQKAELASYSPNKVVIQASADKTSLLFLSDNYYNEWEVKIDGAKKEIFIADYSFRAVEIPKGNHKVEFYYSPNSFKLGLSLSILSFILIMSFVGYNIVRLFNAKKNSIVKK